MVRLHCLLRKRPGGRRERHRRGREPREQSPGYHHARALTRLRRWLSAAALRARAPAIAERPRWAAGGAT